MPPQSCNIIFRIEIRLFCCSAFIGSVFWQSTAIWNQERYRNKLVGFGNIIFWACVWDSGCQRLHIQFCCSESRFYNASFLLGRLLKKDCLGEIIFWACVRDSGCQRTHIHFFFGESQFYNASFLSGPLLKYDCLGTIIFWTCVWDSGCQWTHIHLLVNLSFIMHLFY